jgi:hypothetical protein
MLQEKKEDIGSNDAKKNIISYFYKQLHNKCNGVYTLSSVHSNKEKFYNLVTKGFEVQSKKTGTIYKKMAVWV